MLTNIKLINQKKELLSVLCHVRKNIMKVQIHHQESDLRGSHSPARSSFYQLCMIKLLIIIKYHEYKILSATGT